MKQEKGASVGMRREPGTGDAWWEGEGENRAESRMKQCWKLDPLVRSTRVMFQNPTFERLYSSAEINASI